jgi:ABC-2 type transport system permease protein
MKFIDVALKDLRQTLRSAFALGMMVAAPLLIISLIYFAFGGLNSNASATPPAVQVGLVNLDTLPADTPLEESLGATIHRMFVDPSVAAWITAADYADEAAARSAVAERAAGVAVIVPAGFTADVLAGRPASVLIVSDPTLSVGPQMAEAMVRSLLQGVAGGGIALETTQGRLLAAGQDPQGLDAGTLLQDYATWYRQLQRDLLHQTDRAALVLVAPTASGTGGDTLSRMIAQMAAGQMIFFAFYTGAYSMMSLLREEEEGTLARLFATPTSRTGILAGKLLAVILSVIVQGLVLMAAAHFAFGVDWGQPATVGLALIGQVAAASGLGVLLIAFVKTTRQAGPVLGGGLTVLGMLGGLFSGAVAMPEAFTRLADFTPQGWVMKAWTLALEGQPATEVLVPCVVLVVVGGVFFAAGVWRIQRRFA